MNGSYANIKPLEDSIPSRRQRAKRHYGVIPILPDDRQMSCANIFCITRAKAIRFSILSAAPELPR